MQKKTMQKTTDMTQGKPLGLLVGFAAPLLLGSLCQLLYTTVDSAVVGRLIGVDAFAAVGAAEFLSWLVYEIIIGLVQGFGVLFAQLFGKKDLHGLRRAVAMAILLSLGIGAVLTAAGLLCAGPILALMDTPADILPGALTYVKWMYCGALVTLANRLSGILLQALGNSRAPVTASLASCVLNILLDLLFVGAFQWGVAGVAAATVMAQLGSFLYCFARLCTIPDIRLSRGDFSPAPFYLRELLRLGLPPAFRNGVISVGGLFVQAAINSHGKLFVAGMTAAHKFFGLLTLIGGSLDGAFATYSAQNFGAGQMARIKEGLRCCVRLTMIASACTAAAVALFGRQLVGLLVTGTPEDMGAIVQSGYEYLVLLAVTVPLMFLLCLYRSGLEGMGSPLAPTLSGFMELGMRLLSVLLLPGLLGRWAVYLADPLGWLGGMALLCAAYHYTFRREQRKRAETLPEP